jgi:1,2-dihydroxy-3-keto-5-methylthiopentene dioxygenase
MTLLHIVPDSGGEPALRTTNPVRITMELFDHDVRFERWTANRVIGPDPDPKEVLAAYRAEVDRLVADHGFQFVDVARMVPAPDDPQWPARALTARRTFLEEHTHGDDEVRFFVEGRGCFYLHFGDYVHAVVCEAGDLLSVPAGTRHWFDIGHEPSFCAIRFFANEDGWVGDFTGDPVSARVPRLDELMS